jgi:hypothetical protein
MRDGKAIPALWQKGGLLLLIRYSLLATHYRFPHFLSLTRYSLLTTRYRFPILARQLPCPFLLDGRTMAVIISRSEWQVAQRTSAEQSQACPQGR